MQTPEIARIIAREDIAKNEEITTCYLSEGDEKILGSFTADERKEMLDLWLGFRCRCQVCIL